MAVEFTMPQLGLTMTEGTVVQWLKSIGDSVALGDLIVEVETEKVNYQVESTLEGVLLEILVPEGNIAIVKAPLAVIGQPGEKVERAPISSETAAEIASTPDLKTSTSPSLQAVVEDRIKASPIAKRIAREENINLSEIAGTGPEGRIVERDVLKHREERKIKASPLAAKVAEEFNVDLASMQQNTRIMKDDVLARLAQISLGTSNTSASVVPISGIRKVIADRMSMSWQNAPHVNMTAEVDMTAATNLKERLTKASDRKISFTDIIVKCVAQALQEFPVVNASLIEGKIVSHNHVNVGIAVALENGLIVPVVRHANLKTIANIREEISSLSDKARRGGLSADELSQGTFTVTNLGMFGVDHFTPIINPPESAILGVCRIVDRPIVQCGEVVIKPMMNLCLSFDHRLVDGAVGAQYLARLRQLLEEPLLLL